jgi:hypothetical protein
VREHRYRLSAGIRPLLLFWIIKDNVGGARVVWRAGMNGVREHELTIGSDPARAPRKVNRWGYVRERTDDRSAETIGFMTESDDQSLDEAKARVEDRTQRGPIFKEIRSTVVPGRSRSATRAIRAPEQWSYRDLGAVMAAFEAGSAPSPKVREVPVAPGLKPGFLMALVDLLHDNVEASRRDGGRGPMLEGRSVSYVFSNTPYTLTLRKATRVPIARIDGRDYTGLVRHEFETLNQVARSRERFTILCPVEGPLAEVPIQVVYQPRWWFKAELVLDDREVF